MGRLKGLAKEHENRNSRTLRIEFHHKTHGERAIHDSFLGYKPDVLTRGGIYVRNRESTLKADANTHATTNPAPGATATKDTVPGTGGVFLSQG